MKTTVEIDEKKLMRVMKLGGFRTRKEAIDYALTEAEKKGRLRTLESKPFYVTESEVIFADYDLRKIRNQDVPNRGHRH